MTIRIHPSVLIAIVLCVTAFALCTSWVTGETTDPDEIPVTLVQA